MPTATVTLTIRLSPEMYQELKKAADRQHVSVNRWLGDAVKSALQK